LKAPPNPKRREYRKQADKLILNQTTTVMQRTFKKQIMEEVNQTSVAGRVSPSRKTSVAQIPSPIASADTFVG
jgi:hypothetical protein